MTSSTRVLHLPRPTAGADGLIGKHATFAAAVDMVDRAAPSRLPVVLCGETGSGKELLAERLHARSRRPGPLVAVNAAALPETLAEAELFGVVRGAYTGAVRDRPGLLEVAHQGTLLLDEADDLTPTVQARLLRVLEAGRVRRVGGTHEYAVDLRLVLCLQRPPAELVHGGRWRPDFLYRVSGVEIRVPPLRERTSDIPLLVDHFLAGHGRPPLGGAPALLVEYPWPGNVRQLRTVVDRAVMFAGDGPIAPALLLHALDSMDGPLGARLESGSQAAIRDIRRAELEQQLRVNSFSIRRTADVLGLSRSQLYRRMHALGVPLPRARS